MNSLFTYLLQASLALLLFYGIYWFFLKKETYYLANRFYLMFALLCAVLIPLGPIRYTVQVASVSDSAITEIGKNLMGLKPYAGESFDFSKPFNWQQAILMIYLTGAAIFLTRLLVQTILLFVHSNAKKIRYFEGVKVIESDKYGLPFSFFNLVYINPKFHTQDVLPQILAHEKVHIRERHWIDLLFIELLTVIFWFNPIIWFFEHSIKLNHEYLADDGVISNGNHPGKYQALLVNQLMGMQIIGITNNLNFGINTNRLKMMTKQKTPQIKTIKLAWAMPVIAILLFAFAEPRYEIKQPENPVNENDNQQVVEKNLKKITGKVVDENGVGFAGVSILVKGTTQGTVTDKDGTFNLEVASNDQIVFSFIGKETLNYSVEDLFFKNNKIVMKPVAIYLDPEKYFKDSPQSRKEEAIEEKINPPQPPAKKYLNKDGEELIFIVVERMPEYPGGFKVLGDYITEMEQRLAKSENIKGKAKVSFTIDENGKATNIKIVEQDNDGVGKGAATIVMNMETWSPGKQRNKPVPVEFILPVEFK